MNKLKIVWICHLSNSQIRNKLKFSKWTLLSLYRKIKGINCNYDFARWNSNAIIEFQKFNDIELHIISPHNSIRGVQEFQIQNVNYHIFESEDDNFINKIKVHFSNQLKQSYEKNSKIINKLIHNIKPNIVHLIGAENPYYAESVLSLEKNIPLIVSLQTLVNDSKFLNNYPISQEQYDYISKIEKKIIKRANYIGTRIINFKEIIIDSLAPNAKFLDMTLAVGEVVNIKETVKKYDFVYFAANISKAVDHAIEAFAIAKQTFPDISLHIVGDCDDAYMQIIKNRICKLNLNSSIDFTGKLPNYSDVISEICKATFALLPLKVDFISSTIRESIANGLPVITSITSGTPLLNKERESVLLSEIGDFNQMAKNMCRLLSDSKYAKHIQQNAIITLQEMYGNEKFMQEWREIYYNILRNE